MQVNIPLSLSFISNAPVSEDPNSHPPTHWVSLTPHSFGPNTIFDKNVFYCTCYFCLVNIWWNFGTIDIVYDWPPKRSGTVYIHVYISFQFYSGIKTFRSLIGAFYVFLRKHVPEKLIVAQSVLVSTYPLLRSLCFDKTHGIVATQKSS